MGLGEGEEDRRRGEAILEALHRLGNLATETDEEGVQSLASLWQRGGLEDGGGLSAKPASESPGGLGEDVPGQVDRASLELGFGQGQTGGGSEAGVAIGDDQLHAREATVDQLAKQVGPGVRDSLGPIEMPRS